MLAARLKMVGSCRGAADEERIRALQEEAEQLGVSAFVDWRINLSRDALQRELAGACGGLHTMLDEHFGISVVEYMAAGSTPSPPPLNVAKIEHLSFLALSFTFLSFPCPVFPSLPCPALPFLPSPLLPCPPLPFECSARGSARGFRAWENGASCGGQALINYLITAWLLTRGSL